MPLWGGEGVEVSEGGCESNQRSVMVSVPYININIYISILMYYLYLTSEDVHLFIFHLDSCEPGE